MDRKIEGAAQIAFAIIVVAAVLYFSNDIEKLQTYGYLGAFLISMLSSATLFFPAPGWAAVIAMSSILDPVYLGIAAGLGSAIGELTGYVAGDGARDILNKNIRESKKIEEFVKKYDLAAIFFFAFIPNPLFDIAGIVAGGLKIPWWRYLIACAAGRVLRYTLLAAVGNFALAAI
ncbi:SNARE associated Golgi protein [Candidatus Bilamarchaeum dharawalense]|uniref:SNARE associated Golgi protein n=1 Tax=Candidatus Bilamarchaeum dharawalense TaxID=2885759 RepID=A0A5E4LRP7_9ARCH|nr:SNARE associated Golgi protein [Candidatus Bilamarchaeum dharawalense]